MTETDPRKHYPLGSRAPDTVTTPAGVPLAEVTLAALLDGRVDGDDLRATPDTLRRQAAVARADGRPELAENLERAAELAGVPTDVILEIYTALRPRRSTAATLGSWAERLERDHAAPRTAAFLREACDVYSRRNLLALGDDPADATL